MSRRIYPVQAATPPTGAPAISNNLSEYSATKEVVRAVMGLAATDLSNVTPGSVTEALLSSELIAMLTGGHSPADFLGNITALTDNLADPTTSTDKWYFVDGVSGTMTGANPPGADVEDGGFVFSDGATWNVRAAAPTIIPNSSLAREKLSSALQAMIPPAGGYTVTTDDLYDAAGDTPVWAIVDQIGNIGFAVYADGRIVVTTADFDDNTIATAKIADAAVTEDKQSRGVSVWSDPDRGNVFPATSFRSISVLGDSISSGGLWPALLNNRRQGLVHADSVGGSASPEIMSRSRVQELVYPKTETDTITPGTVQIRTTRFRYGRELSTDYRTTGWYAMATQYDEVLGVEFYNNGAKIGESFEPDTQTVTTDYSTSTKKIYAPGHGKSDGDLVYFDSPDVIPLDKGIGRGSESDRVYDQSGSGVYTKSGFPHNLIYRKQYVIANAGLDDYELKEREADASTIDLMTDATVTLVANYGYSFDCDYTGGDWDITIKPILERRDWTTVIFVGTNDRDWNTVDDAKSNILSMVDDLQPLHKRFLIIGPFNGAYSNADSAPGGAGTVFVDTLTDWLRLKFRENFLDLRGELFADRTQTELDLLADPTVPELLKIGGTPEAPIIDNTSGQEQWVGPGYLPLLYRPETDGAWDLIHPSDYDRITDIIEAKLNSLNY